jgi:hypothetical protein
MARIEFTPQLRRFVETPEVDSAAADLRGALDEVFAAHPRLRGYVLDDPLAPDSRVYVLQALSGG